MAILSTVLGTLQLWHGQSTDQIDDNLNTSVSGR